MLFVAFFFFFLFFMSTVTLWTLRAREPRTATSTFTHLLSSESSVQVQCCFTSTETVRTVRDGEPRVATSTFTQLLSSESSTWAVLLYLASVRSGIQSCKRKMTCSTGPSLSHDRHFAIRRARTGSHWSSEIPKRGRMEIY